MLNRPNEKNLFFLKIYIVEKLFFCLNLNSISNLCSFEVYHVDVAKKAREY